MVDPAAQIFASAGPSGIVRGGGAEHRQQAERIDQDRGESHTVGCNGGTRHQREGAEDAGGESDDMYRMVRGTFGRLASGPLITGLSIKRTHAARAPSTGSTKLRYLYIVQVIAGSSRCSDAERRSRAI